MPWNRGAPGTHPVHAPGKITPQERYLKRSTMLVRRSAIRQLLAGRYHVNGIASLAELKRLLKVGYGITVHIQSLSRDLMEMGAIKVKDEERPTITWWVVPAFNPNIENLREDMDPKVVEQELQHKISSHVTDTTTVGAYIYLLTEPRAGPLVAYWVSWLKWGGMVFVQEQMDACVIHCLDERAARHIYARLLGDQRIEEGYEDDAET
ncbi:MAG: hypothetical protein H0U67_16615 [Gemmatimonadetes bacterium]|nr:hypothetical protein [Gemmatimonadota bacterium]